MKKRVGLTILGGLIGLAGLAMAGGTKQYTVTLNATGGVTSASVTIFICTDSICQSPTDIGTIHVGGTGTVTATFTGPASAKSFSYELTEVDYGHSSGVNAIFSAEPIGAPISIGNDLIATVATGGGGTTGGSKHGSGNN